MMPPRILVAGIGNIFLGDDAFGVEVARRLAGRGLPEGARVVDFGIRGLDLSYALLDGHEAVVLVDAAPRGGRPGTLYVLELALGDPAEGGEGVLVDPHHLDPARALRQAASLGGQVGRLILVGCEPNPVDESEDFGAEMSGAVRTAVDEAVPLILSLVARLLRGEEVGPGGNGTIIAGSFQGDRSCDDTPHPNPPPQGGREPDLKPSPLVGEGWGGGTNRPEMTFECPDHHRGG